MTIRVIIVDDHEVVRRGLESMFRDTELKVVAEAANGEEALQRLAEHKPDVALVDVRLPDFDGLEAIERLRTAAPSVKVVILSTYDNPTYFARASALGVSDYILKGAPRGEVIAAITRAIHRQPPPENSPFGQFRRRMSQPRVPLSDTKAPLTDREYQVLRHIALGLSNRDVGLALGISVETVKEHVQNILRKLECADRTAAAVWALRHGMA